jgi:hypothetical protein
MPDNILDGYKLIPLTQGQFAIVDNQDYDWLNQWKWHAQKGKTTYYATRVDYSNGKKNRKLIFMHKVILGIGPEITGDHIDRNGLNNRRSNLRKATHSQNMCNRISFKASSSKYKGVGIHKSTNKWAAYIRKNNVQKHLGLFDTEEEAAIAYNEAALTLHGEFALLNNIERCQTA